MSQNSPNNHILEDTLHHIFQFLDALDDSPRPLKPSELTDNRLEQNILQNIQRHRASLDWLIAHQAAGRVRRRTRKVLLWALTELLEMDGAPAHAVVDTATHYVKKHHAVEEANFVNAFLRKLCDCLTHGTDPLANAPEAIRLEMPEALWKRWCAAYGEETARAVAQAILKPSRVLFRRQAFPLCNRPIPADLTGLDLPSAIPATSSFYSIDGKTMDLTAFLKEHPEYIIQDPATCLAPALLNPQPGETIADLCAAPGGKSRLIAEALQGKGTLLSREKNAAKLTKMKQNLGMFKNVSIEQDDATCPHLAPNSLDGLLLDVPCSNTGVLRRKPDAKWSFSTQKINELTAIQKAILNGAAPLVKSGGRLVYSTCSLEPEENTRQVQDFLAAHADFSLVQETQLLPSELHDGAYAALLIKK